MMNFRSNRFTFFFKINLFLNNQPNISNFVIEKKQIFGIVKKILLIDNNDSFTYNLVQILEENDCSVEIVLNSEAHKVRVSDYSGIVISPGPGEPSDYDMLFKFLEENYLKNKFLGVCLGHQVIGEFFGAKNIQLEQVHHGEQSKIKIIADTKLYEDFSQIETPFTAGRYHSWVLSSEYFPECLKRTAEDENGLIMSIEHRNLPIFGVQYHPESFMTPLGEKIIQNWLQI
jgi:anthranilate synthase/aminodeoxychorismate synthase-like glutamine amidotransferase